MIFAIILLSISTLILASSEDAESTILKLPTGRLQEFTPFMYFKDPNPEAERVEGAMWDMEMHHGVISYMEEHINVPGKKRFYMRVPDLIKDGAGILSGPDRELIQAVAARLHPYKEYCLSEILDQLVAESPDKTEARKDTHLVVGKYTRPCNVLVPSELQRLLDTLEEPEKDGPVCEDQEKTCADRFAAIKTRLESLAAAAPVSHKALILVPVKLEQIVTLK